MAGAGAGSGAVPDLLGPVVVGRPVGGGGKDVAEAEAWEVVHGAASLSDVGAVEASDTNDDGQETEALVAKPDASDTAKARDYGEAGGGAMVSISLPVAVACGVLSGLLLATLAVVIVDLRAGGMLANSPPSPTTAIAAANATSVNQAMRSQRHGHGKTLRRPLPPQSFEPPPSRPPAAKVNAATLAPAPAPPPPPPPLPEQPPQLPMTREEKHVEVQEPRQREEEEQATSVAPLSFGAEVLVTSEGDWVEDVLAGRDPLYTKMLGCIAGASASDANRRRKRRRRRLEGQPRSGGGPTPDDLATAAAAVRDSYSDVPASWYSWLSRLEERRLAGQGGATARSSLERVLGAGKPKRASPLPPLSPEDQELARSLRTTWRCQEAHNSRGKDPPQLACLFKNLYVEARGRDSLFVAHALAGDSELSPPISQVRRAEIMTGNANTMGNTHPPLRWEEHSSLQELAEAIRLKGGVTTHRGLSLAIHTVWHFNIGHAMFDGLYPTFLSLVQFARQDEPFRTIVINGREGPIENALPGAYDHVEETLGVIGGLGHLLLRRFNGSADRKSEAPLHRLEEAVIGRGLNGQKLDVNANMSLGGCRLLDGCRAFRRHVFSSVGLPQPPPARSKPPFRVIVVQNKRYGKGVLEKVTAELQKDPGLSDFKINFVNWSPNRPAGANPSLQTGNFTRHMEIIANTDIHVSGPGTGQMYQTFLPDGAVHVNLGDVSQSGQGYMEEYMAEGSPYLRALYYKRRVPSQPFLDAASVAKLLGQARRLLESPLNGPTPISSNLSPVGKVYKAYCHLRHRERIAKAGGQLVPLREIGIPPYLGNHFPEEYVYGQSNKPELTQCLLRLLRTSFDRRFPELGTKKGSGWFGTAGGAG